MKNRSFSILIALLVAFPFMTYSLPVYSLNGSQRVSQQKRGHQGSNFVSGKDKSIFDVQFSPDGTLLAIATDLGILLYGTKTYDKPEILKGHTGEIYCIAFRPDGKVLASAGGGHDRTVRLWNVNTRQQIRIFGISLSPTSDFAFSPDGKILASASGADHVDPKEDVMNIYLWDADTGELLRTLSGHTGPVNDVAFCPDGKILASTSEDLTVRLWNVSSGQQIRILTGHTDAHMFMSIAFSPDGNMLVTGGGYHNAVGLWDANTGQQIRTLTLNPHFVQKVNEHMEKSKTLTGEKGWKTIKGDDVAFSPDGNTIASTGHSSIHLWDTDSGQYHRILHNGYYALTGTDLAFSPDGNTIVGIGWEGAHVWDVKTEKLIRVLISKRGY